MIIERSQGHFDYEGTIASMLWEAALTHVQGQYPETNFMRPASDEERRFMEDQADDLFIKYSHGYCQWLVESFLENDLGR